MRFHSLGSGKYRVVVRGTTAGTTWKSNGYWVVCDRYGNLMSWKHITRKGAGEHLAWLMRERFGS